jgi:hypothetical protein
MGYRKLFIERSEECRSTMFRRAPIAVTHLHDADRVAAKTRSDHSDVLPLGENRDCVPNA